VVAHTQLCKPVTAYCFRPKLFIEQKLHKIMKNKHQTVAAILLVMRITFVQIILSAVCITSLNATEANSQSVLDKPFTISVENMQLKKVISSIQKQTKVKFTFSTNAINAERMVTYSARGKKISDFLNDVLKAYYINYQVVDDQIILYPASVGKTGLPIESGLAVVKPDKTISGVVTNDKGEPLTGVTVAEKNKSNAVITDEKGYYSIRLADENAVLVFSSIGYESQEASIASLLSLNIILKTANKALDEVIVVGYGSQKRSDITGSVASVPKERLSKLPVTNILHAIEGSVAGVNVTQTSSVPGSSAAVLIRGQNTITAGTGPFIVVDGVPFSKSGGGTNDINPNDIASIEILKDASATAIYGVNGANGVILITTKRGIAGKPAIRYNTHVGFDDIAHMLDPSSPQQYVKKYADWFKQVNPTQTQVNVLPNAYEIANYNAGKTVDWLKEVTQQGIFQDHNVSISGGTKDMKYYLSGDYLKQKGAVKGYQYHRASLRSNIDINITDYLTTGTSLSYTNNNYDGGRANFYLAAAMSPYGTLYNAAGGYEIYPMNPELLYTNPLLGLNTDRIDRSNNLTANTYAEIKPGGVLKGLKYRLNTGYTYVTTLLASYTGRNANNTIGSASTSNSETKNWVVENILTYDKNFGAHHIDFTGLYSAQQRNYFATAFNATGFINDELSFNNMGAGATISGGTIFPGQPYTGSYKDKYSLVSQMGRINYSYDSRYLLTVTARRDGSSVMGSNTSKYGVFPSFAAGWNISNEKFLDNVRLINHLKLRTSYGKSGNEAIGVYGTITTAGTVRYPFGGTSNIGVLASNLGNSDLHWETSKTFNVGLDFGILNNKINGSIDIYSTKTEGLLLRRNLPIITGYSFVLDNLGITKNKGIEITLNSDNISTTNFKWQTTVVFSSNKNRIVDLYGDRKSDLGNRWFIGQPINVIYDYKLAGVWQAGDNHAVDPGTKDGDLKFADTNGDNKITPDDRIILGQTAPKWIGGLTNTFRFKNIYLSIFIQTFQGALNNNVTLTYADEAGRMNIPAETGYWTAENKNNSRPSLAYNSGTRGYGYASDNSYTRIKDVTLSYSFAQNLLDKLKLGSLTLYASGRNLYTFTDWIGWDPENNYSFRGSGDWTNNYPLTRSIVFGANITLR
jgi:TonB-linked SusC/RagA family outer membrane protein